ncbi:MAG: RluA family pseudouridine synthase [Patescibacteria group bacterium]
MRIDVFLHQKFPEQTRGFWQRRIREGAVKINGKMVKSSHEAIKGDEKIEMEDIQEKKVPQKKSSTQDVAIPFSVMFEDKDLMVIDKPAGVAVHPPSPMKTILDSIQETEPAAKLVHRLDKDTSGILVLAKSEAMHAKLSQQWKERKVEKQYLALVRGRFEVSEGAIEAPIRRSIKDRKKMAVSSRPGSRPAVTKFKVQETFRDVSLIQAFPKTGRTHQIRVHFESIGHPIVGDHVYGDSKLNKKFEQQFGLKRQFLHAEKLSFVHPRTQKKLEFTAKIPGDLQGVVDGLEKQRS